MRRIIVITGTPGTGKTTLARDLKRKIKGSEMIEATGIINEEKLSKGYASDGAKLVNMKKLSNALHRRLRETKAQTVILEGHLLCELKVNGADAIVLRAHLRDIEKRLKLRNYQRGKLADNIMSEALDYCGVRASKNYRRVFELLGTRKQLLDAALRITKGKEREGKSIELLKEIQETHYKKYLS